MQDLIEQAVLPAQFEILTDAKVAAGGPPALAMLRAVGAVADVRYQSGRVIPASVQAAAVQDAKAQGRQMTMYVGHPQPGIDVSGCDVFTGRIEDVAAIVEEFRFDEASKKTILDRIRILDTEHGRELLELIKAGVKLGVSQRATGRYEERELKIDGQYVPAVVVTEIYGIWGWDAVHLPVANAGSITELVQLTDSVIRGSRGKTMPPELNEKDTAKTETPAASKALGQSILDMLDQMQKRADTIMPALKASSAEAAGIYRAIFQGQAQARALMDSVEPEDVKQQKLAVLAQKVMDDFRSLPASPAAAVVAHDGSALTVKDLADQMVERARREDYVAGLKAYGSELLAAEKLSDDDRIRAQALVDSYCGPHVTRDQVKHLVERQVEQYHRVTAAIKARQVGLNGGGPVGVNDTGPGGVTSTGSPITAGAGGHLLEGPALEGARALFDSLTIRGGYEPSVRKPEDVHPKLKLVLDAFDRINERRLLEEKAKLLSLRGTNGLINDAAVGQYLADTASIKADFDTPATLSRLVISEVYAMPIFRELTDFGVMVSQVDQVPIERWRGEGDAKTFRPSVSQRRAVRGELIPIPQGRHFVDFVTLTAIGRKLGTTMSLEFLTRAKRHPQITGVAMAVKALIQNIQRILQQDIFEEKFWGAAFHGSEAFTYTANGTGSDSTFQVIGSTAADAVTIVPNRGTGTTGELDSELVVAVGTTSSNRTAVPEFGTATVGGGPSSAFFYTVDHVLALINFVDADGNALEPPSGTNNIQVTGKKASSEKRFDLKLPSQTSQEEHMRDLLFEVSNMRAKLSSGGITAQGYYDADYLLASVVVSEYMKQAKSYAALERRNAYKADAEIQEGNYGITAGLGHWGSKVHADDHIVIGNRMSTLFYQYEPASLRGPVEAVNSSGKLIGAQEYYTYGEDAILEPVPAKSALISLYRSS